MVGWDITDQFMKMEKKLHMTSYSVFFSSSKIASRSIHYIIVPVLFVAVAGQCE